MQTQGDREEEKGAKKKHDEKEISIFSGYTKAYITLTCQALDCAVDIVLYAMLPHERILNFLKVRLFMVL